MNPTLATVPALLTFSEVAAAPGPLAITEDFRNDVPGDLWLTGRHGGAYITGKWLALTPSTRIEVHDRSVREGRSVFGFLELADGRFVSLSSVYAARDARVAA